VQSLWDYVKIKISICIGIAVNVPYAWRESYKNAKVAMEYKFLLESRDFVYGKELVEIQHKNGYIPVNQWSGRLELLIKLNQEQELKKALDELSMEIRKNCTAKKDIILYVQNIFLSILLSFEDSQGAVAIQYEEERSLLKGLTDCKNLSELKYDLEKLCIGLMKKITGQKDGEGRRLSILAMDYIEKNYMDSNMSLNMVCAYLGVSISYFSMHFKNYTGDTFVEVLTRIRIEKARKLMDTTDCRAYEIAEKVGYNDPHYFSMIFKKVTGMTPSEYAKGVK
jgi:two-component system response regulator YesN